MAWVVYASDSKTSGAYADLPTARKRAQAEANRTGRSAIVYPTSRTGKAKGKTHHVRPSATNPRRRHSKRTNPSGLRYRGVITAIPGHLLRGGVKKVVSSWFATKQDAHDWIYAMEQPGIETHHIERGTGRIDIGPRGSWVRKNPGPKRYPTKKKPGDPTYSAQWSGVTGAPKIKGKVCARCGGKVHREGGSAYCPYCDDYVQTVASNPSGAVTLSTARKLQRFKSNPNRLIDVIVRKNGQTFKAKAKYDAGQRRVRVFVNPRVAQSINPRPRKTRDYFAVEGYYYGTWEEVTAEDHRKEALQRLKEYRENEHGTAFRLKKKREKIEAA